MQLTLHGLRKKGNRRLELGVFRLYSGPIARRRCGRFSLISGMFATEPTNLQGQLGIPPCRLHVQVIADAAAVPLEFPAPLVHRHVGAGRIPCALLFVSLVAPAVAPGKDSLTFGFVPACGSLRRARAAVSASGPSRPAAPRLRTLPTQRQGSHRRIEVVKAVVAGVSEHKLAVRGGFGTRLFQTLTLRTCLRISPSQARKVLRFRREEEGVQTRSDGSQVIPEGQSGLLGARFSPSAAVAGGSAALEDLARAVDRDLATPDLAPSTERAYAHDWADFSAFCDRHELQALPAAPQTLALYLKSLETARSRAPSAYRRQPPAERIYIGPTGLALPTLRRRLAAIAVRHTAVGCDTPTDHPLVRRMLRRYARTRGTAMRKKEPLTIERLPALLLAMTTEGPAAVRDRALLLLGYAGAFRRSELVALDVEDLKFAAAGLYVWIAGAKNDPRKKGRELYVPRLPNADLCAVAALDSWLEVVGVTGPLFRTFDLRGRLTATSARPGRRRADPTSALRGRRRRR